MFGFGKKENVEKSVEKVEKSVDLKNYGFHGLEKSYGFITEDPDQKLHGPSGRKKLKEMVVNDSTCSAVLFAIENLIRQVKWRVDEYDNNPESEANADFIRDALSGLHNQNIDDVVSHALDMLTYGFSIAEINYKRLDNGQIVWKRFAPRSVASIYEWRFDENEDAVAVVQQHPTDFRTSTIPLSKCLHFTTRKNSPEGRSILRGAFRSYVYKNNFEKILAIGVYRDLAGLPKLKVPVEFMSDDASASQKAIYEKMIDMVSKVHRDEMEGIILPSYKDDKGNDLFDFSLVASSGSRQFDINAIISTLDQRIAMSVLADFLLLGSGDTGSYALSSDKTRLFALACNTFLEIICDVLQKEIENLCRLNGITENIPVLNFSDLEKPELDKLAPYLGALSGLGAVLNDKQLNYLYSLADIPMSEDEF